MKKSFVKNLYMSQAVSIDAQATDTRVLVLNLTVELNSQVYTNEKILHTLSAHLTTPKNTYRAKI